VAGAWRVRLAYVRVGRTHGCRMAANFRSGVFKRRQTGRGAEGACLHSNSDRIPCRVVDETRVPFWRVSDQSWCECYESVGRPREGRIFFDFAAALASASRRCCSALSSISLSVGRYIGHSGTTNLALLA